MKHKVPTEQWHDRLNGKDSEAVSEEMHGSRTCSIPSYDNLQGPTTPQQPTSTSRAAEWKEMQSITANKKPDTECPQAEF